MACVICGKETDLLWDRQFDLTYDCCPYCGFIGQDRDQLVSFQEERDEYDRHENTIENEGYVTYFKKFINASLVVFTEGGQGLDYGSGPEPVLAQVLKRDYGLDVDIYDLHYQPNKVYEGRTYDFITSTEVIEHVKDPVDFVRRFASLLKPGGIAAIMTLFHPEDDEKFLDWWYRRDITHISFFTPKTFKEIGDQCGMEIIFCDDNRYITLRKR